MRRTSCWCAAILIVAGGVGFGANAFRTPARQGSFRPTASGNGPVKVTVDGDVQALPIPRSTWPPLQAEDEPIVTRFESPAPTQSTEFNNRIVLSGGEESDARVSLAPRPDPEPRRMPYADESQ